MHKLLSDLLLKWKLKPEELSDDEKKTFDNWHSILEKEVTVETVAEFCKRQQTLIEAKWKDHNRDRTNDTYLADIHAVYGNIIYLLEAKKTERAQLEKQLEQLLDTTPNGNV